MKNNKRIAFTLVELIVVITILAILGTIAFINLQGYSTSARDSKRLSDVNNIQKKIGIELAKGESLGNLITLVKTNLGLTINNVSGSSIQGIANFQTLKENGESFKDPITKGDYVLSYSIGGSGTGAYKFVQISTINEELSQAVVKGNYYIMQVGDSPSITVNSNDYYVVDEGSELPYNATSNEILVNTNRYPGCNNDNITVGSYTISACNIGATISGIDPLISGGQYFQWGRNKGFEYGDNTQQSTTIDGSIGLNASTDTTYGFVWNSSLPSPYTWANTDITNNWGDTTNTSIARQGPCASGYHIPSRDDWDGIITAGGWLNGLDMKTDLQLPFAGNHYWNSGSFGDLDTNGYYWSSSSDGTYGYYVVLGLAFIDPSASEVANGYSIRCFKN